jgi:hypothetical protein
MSFLIGSEFTSDLCYGALSATTEKSVLLTSATYSLWLNNFGERAHVKEANIEIISRNLCILTFYALNFYIIKCIISILRYFNMCPSH